MEKFAIAMSRFKRNKLDECISLCDEILKDNEKDQVAFIYLSIVCSITKNSCYKKKTLYWWFRNRWGGDWWYASRWK